MKANQIVAILESVRKWYGSETLDPLRKMPDDEAEALLRSLPGVGKKVAKCVLMYSLGREVLPVDVHVHRVARRLGVPAKRRLDTSQDAIEGAIPPELRYEFHVTYVANGRALCRAKDLLCTKCHSEAQLLAAAEGGADLEKTIAVLQHFRQVFCALELHEKREVVRAVVAEVRIDGDEWEVALRQPFDRMLTPRQQASDQAGVG